MRDQRAVGEALPLQGADARLKLDGMKYASLLAAVLLIESAVAGFAAPIDTRPALPAVANVRRPSA